MRKITKYRSGLLIIGLIILSINRLWIKNLLLGNIGYTILIAGLLLASYAYQKPQLLLFARIGWRLLLIASLLFIWWNYFFNN